MPDPSIAARETYLAAIARHHEVLRDMAARGRYDYAAAGIVSRLARAVRAEATTGELRERLEEQTR